MAKLLGRDRFDATVFPDDDGRAGQSSSLYDPCGGYSESSIGFFGEVIMGGLIRHERIAPADCLSASYFAAWKIFGSPFFFAAIRSALRNSRQRTKPGKNSVANVVLPAPLGPATTYTVRGSEFGINSRFMTLTIPLRYVHDLRLVRDTARKVTSRLRLTEQSGTAKQAREIELGSPEFPFVPWSMAR